MVNYSKILAPSGKMGNWSRQCIGVVIGCTIALSSKVVAQSDYDKALCVSNAKREEVCSVTMTNKSLIIKYPTGRNESIKIKKIKAIITKDESKRRGFIFTNVFKRYLYSIEFLNVDNDPERITIAFDSHELSKEFDSLLSSKN